MPWSGKDTDFAAVLAASATAWGTSTDLIAASRILVNKTGPPLALPEYKVRETTDTAWPEQLDQGDVKGVEYTIEIPLSYNNTTGVDPITQILFAVLTTGDLSTQQGGTAAYLHTLGIVSGQALTDYILRFATLCWRLKLRGAGYAYAEIPCWQPESFEIESKGGGTDPVMLRIKGKGDKVVTDLSASAANNGATEWTTAGNPVILPQVHHRHIGATGAWWAKSAAVGASPVTFDATTYLNPSRILIKGDRKHDAKPTTTMYIDQPYDNGFAELSVELEFDRITDAFWTGIMDDQKAFEETGVEVAYHFRPRWTYPTAIATTYFPYFEFGFPRLVVLNGPELAAEAGKVMPFKLQLSALRPTAIAHIPTCFQYAGGAAGAARDAMYLAVMDAKVAAYIA
jgi:hypothetical protein